MAKLESFQNIYSYCSNCKQRIVPIGQYNYCPNCGKRFREKPRTPYRDFGYELTAMFLMDYDAIYHIRFWTFLEDLLDRWRRMIDEDKSTRF